LQPDQISIGPHIIPFAQITGIALHTIDPSVPVGPVRIRRAGARKTVTLYVGYRKPTGKVALALVQLEIDDRNIPNGHILVTHLKSRAPEKWRGSSNQTVFALMKELGYDTSFETTVIIWTILAAVLVAAGFVTFLTMRHEAPPRAPSPVGGLLQGSGRTFLARATHN
jgi:hypothetical protein